MPQISLRLSSVDLSIYCRLVDFIFVNVHRIGHLIIKITVYENDWIEIPVVNATGQIIFMRLGKAPSDLLIACAGFRMPK